MSHFPIHVRMNDGKRGARQEEPAGATERPAEVPGRVSAPPGRLVSPEVPARTPSSPMTSALRAHRQQREASGSAVPRPNRCQPSIAPVISQCLTGPSPTRLLVPTFPLCSGPGRAEHLLGALLALQGLPEQQGLALEHHKDSYVPTAPSPSMTSISSSIFQSCSTSRTQLACAPTGEEMQVRAT